MVLFPSSSAFRVARAVLYAVSWLLLAAVALRYGLTPTGGYDYFWHLKTGEQLWQTRSLLRIESFSYLAQGRPWPYKDAGAELLLYGVEHAWGPGAVVVLKASAFVSLVGFIGAAALRYRRARLWVVLVVLGAGAVASGFRVGELPETLALATTACVLWLIERHRARGASLWWTLPVVALTANLHRSVWTLPPLLLAYAAARALEAHRQGMSTPALLHAERGPLLVAISSFGAALSTPFLLHGLSSSLSMMGARSYNAVIPEWSPVTPAVLWAASPWAYALLALVGLGVAARGRRQQPWDLALCLLGGALCLRSVRFVPYPFLFGALPACSGLSFWVEQHTNAARRAVGELLGAALAASVSLLFALVALFDPLPLPHLGLQEQRYPDAALAFVQTHGIRGRVLNEFHYGGYLLYHLWPATQVFVDGRNDWLFTPQELELSTQVLIDGPSFERARLRYGFEWLFLGNRPDEQQRLHFDNDPGWALVFTSEAALVYVRRDGPNAALAASAYRVLKAHELGASISAAVRTGPRTAALAVAEAERMVREDPQSFPANLALAEAYGLTGRPEARAQLERARSLASRRR